MPIVNTDNDRHSGSSRRFEPDAESSPGITMDIQFPTDSRIESLAASTPRYLLDEVTQADEESST